MNKLRLLQAGLICCSFFAVNAEAGKPVGPGSPALGYVINGGSGWDLRVANEDGTSAFTIYPGSTSVSFDMGLKGSNTAAIIDNRVAKLLTWEISPSGAVTPHQQVLSTTGQAMNLAFSQDGSKIAVFTSPDYVMHIFDAASGSEITSWPSEFAYDIAWYRDGLRIAINAAPSDTVNTYHLMSYNAADGSNAQTLGTFASLEDIDTSRSASDDSVLVSYGTATDIRINEFLNGTNGPVIVKGTAQSWRCDGARFVFQQFSGSKGGMPGPWLFHDNSGLNSTFSKSSQIRRVHFMKC